MPPKNLTDTDRALSLNYPVRPTQRGRAVIKWKQVACDMGPYGSAESFFTLLALRKHFAEGGAPPSMKDLRREVMANADPIVAEDLKALSVDLASMTTDRDELRARVEQLENEAEAHESTCQAAEDSLAESLKRRDALAADKHDLASQLRAANESIEAIARKRPWRSWVLSAISTAACALALSLLAVSEPKVGGQPLTTAERASIADVRSGLAVFRGTDLPPEVDGIVLSEIELRSIRLFRSQSHEAIREQLSGQGRSDDPVLETMRQQGAMEWQESKEATQLVSQSSP
ncbi:MAG: hypothetical protein AAFX06_25545 [Planctomycetota bacterium]